MKDKGMIFNIQHFSVDDGPGIRTVIFMKGCPLDCIWCHNPESKSYKSQLMFDKDNCTMCQSCVNVCEKACHVIDASAHIIKSDDCIFCGKCENVCCYNALTLCGREYSAEQVMDEISKDDTFFGENGGVTFSGGEPFLQSAFLLELLKKCKEKGYHTCVETCGYTDKKHIISCAPYIDIFLYDYKESDSKKHIKYTSVDNKLILDNLSLLNSIGSHVILRCPVIPECNLRREHFESIGKITDEFKCIKAVELMPYHPLGISKCHKLGIIPQYKEEAFLDKNKLSDYADVIKKNTSVPVHIK